MVRELAIYDGSDSEQDARLFDPEDVSPSEPVIPNPSSAEVSAELSRIRALMRTDRRTYDADPALQARYRELLAVEAGGNDGGSVEQYETGFAPMPTLSAWKRRGEQVEGYSAHVDLVHDVNSLLMPLSDRERAELNLSFDRLPHNTQMKALGILVDKRTVAPAFISGPDMDRLMTVPAYAELAREWGGEAQQKLGTACARMWRVLDQLSDHEARTAMAWLDALPKAAAKAVCRRLAAQT